MSNYIKTIDDLIAAQYGVVNGRLAKDAPVVSSTSGVYNRLYSYGLFLGITLEANAFGVLPKKPWNTSGYRVVQAASASSAGIAQGAAIPATVKSTYWEVDFNPKVLVHATEMSTTQNALEGKDDVLTWQQDMDTESEVFKNILNRNLLKDMNTTAPGSETGLDSIDRHISTTASDVTGCGATAADEDPWGTQDRSDATENAGSWLDSTVSHNGTAGTETDREFSLSYLDTVLAGTMPYWKSPDLGNKVYITGYDTLFDWNQAIMPFQRLPEMGVQMTVNGIKTVGGSAGGLMVKSYNGIPIIASNNVVQDTKSRVYQIDLDNMSIDMLIAPEVLTADNVLLLGKMVKEAAFHMEGELVTTNFRSQGKVRGLK